MNLLTAKPWIDFLENIKLAKEELNTETIWFRGHGNSKFYLLPSLLRYKNGIEYERDAFHKFRRFGDKIFKNKESEWETLFDMQHYGIPTRLLDWTESLGIAIYFAAYYNKYEEGKDAAIYLLNPYKLNEESGRNRIYQIPYEEKDFPYSRTYWDRAPFKATAPIAIIPIFKNDRILAQRGTFTVHHDDIEPIDAKFPKAIKKVVLPGDAIESAQEFLEIANINEFSVFPDLSGVAGFMKKTSGLINRW